MWTQMGGGGHDLVTNEALSREPWTTPVGHVSVDRLLSVFDAMFEGVWLISDDRRTIYANGAMGRLLGSTPVEMRGRAVTDFLDVAAWAEIGAYLERSRTHAGEGIEVCISRADDDDLFVIVAVIGTHEGAHIGTMLSVTNVTGRRSIDARWPGLRGSRRSACSPPGSSTTSTTS